MCRDHRDGYKGLVSAAQARTSSERDTGLILSLRPPEGNRTPNS